eukprot:TRINITY_DN2778_c0_g1_i6.p1 TRINITY_DN2778_c0_g1~~TRINITY_DN2778_c0_g1_i6.p1  ORF type:complete len:299 (+),score=77.32 TRINITY_DN2778_c0_g1_i6:65-961(+)
MGSMDEEEQEAQRLDLLLIERVVIPPHEQHMSDQQKYETMMSLSTLNLDHQRIGSISGLATLHSLVHLSLANNRLRNIHGLDRLANLEVLSLACNQITRVTNLKSLAKLKTLDLSFNLIKELGDPDAGFPTGLCSLQLNGNPLSQLPGYRALIVGKCSELVELDCATVASVERVAARRAIHPPTTSSAEPEGGEQGPDPGADVYGDAMHYASEIMAVQRDSFIERAKMRSGRAKEAGRERKAEMVAVLNESHQVKLELDATIATCAAAACRGGKAALSQAPHGPDTCLLYTSPSPRDS